jgi:GTPase
MDFNRMFPDKPDDDFRSGFVGIAGRPNVGKSTLLNALVGEKVAIVSSLPQTTRNRIAGILNLPREGETPPAQVVLLDTPGIHKPSDRINEFMVEEALDTLVGLDVGILVVDLAQKPGPGDRFVADRLSDHPSKLLVANKVDLLKGNEELLAERIQQYSSMMPDAQIVALSALTGKRVSKLTKLIRDRLTEGPQFYPDDFFTDQPERFIVSELVREQIFRLAVEEVPYSTAVVIETWEEKPEKNLIAIGAQILVERNSQKRIIVGAGGSFLKKVGTQARKQIENLLGTRIYLKLFVKVVKDWSKREEMLAELGYRLPQKK